jgi:ParB/RepB/Spo0J family partition protein
MSNHPMMEPGQEGAQYAELLLDLIEPSKTNPRKRLDLVMIEELAESVRKVGVLQPILVRPHPVEPAMFEIVAGESRWRAAKVAELQYIPATIRDLTDLEALELQVLENLHRNDLHPIEEAEGFQQLLNANGYTVDTLAERVGKSRSAIYASLKLCALCPEAREAFYHGKLTASTALLIARIPGAKLQAQAVNEITKPSHYGELPSYRDAAWTIRRRYALDLNNAVFDITDASLVPSAGDCTNCEKRSGNCWEICPDIDSADVCTDPDCFGEKRTAHIERLKQDPDTITGEEAKEIFPNSSYFPSHKDYDRPSGWHEDKKWSDWLGDELPTRTVVLDKPDTDPIVVVDVQAALQLIEEKGLVADKPAKTPAQIAYEKERVAKLAAEEAEINRRILLVKQLHDKLVNDPTARLQVWETILPIQMEKLISDLSEDESANLLKAIDQPCPNDDEEWSTHIKGLTLVERRILGCELNAVTLDRHVLSTSWSWSPEKQDDLSNFYSILQAAGIDPEQSLETLSFPTSAAHAEQETCAEDQGAEVDDPGPAAQAHEPEAREKDPKETQIQAADKPAAKKRGRPRKQAAETLVTEGAQ